MEKIDSLKMLKNELSPPVSFVSIAYDKEKDNVRNVIKEKNIDWLNLYIGEKDNSLMESLDISCFPTYFIVDRNNVIVYRSCGISIKELRKELLNALK